MIKNIQITTEALDLVSLNKLAQTSTGDMGASVIFTGNVRVSEEEKDLIGMSLEHYPGMTESQLDTIVSKAIERWSLTQVIVSHRVGYLVPGEPIVFIATGGLHRKECFESAQFIMDYLKNNATFWKKEHYLMESVKKDRWVEAKQSDLDSINRWSID